MLTLIEAAAHVGISTRTLERYVKAARIAVIWTKGKTREVMTFNESDLDALKHELEHPNKPAQGVLLAPEQSNPSSALAQVPTNTDHAMTVFVERFSESLIGKMLADTLKERSGVPLEQKLTLSLPEAAKVSGISVEKLRAAVKAKKLKAVKGIGGGYGKVKRADLDDYIKKL